MATTNFLEHNPSQANQEPDSTYSGDGLRTGGVGTNAILPSSFLNKIWRQTTVMPAAIAQWLLNRGISTSDANVGTLASALGAIALQSDIQNAIFPNKLANNNILPLAYVGTNADGTAHAPNPNTGGIVATNILYGMGTQNVENALQIKDGQVATLTANLASESTNRTNADTTLQTNLTNEVGARIAADNTLQAFLQGQIAGIENGFTGATGSQGSFLINVPGAPFGRMLFQWMDGPNVTENVDSQHSGNWPVAFNNIFGAMCTTWSNQSVGNNGDTDIHVMMFQGNPGYNATGWNVRHSCGAQYAVAPNLGCKLFAWGN